MKSEVGNCDDIFISEKFDAASLWEVIEGLSNLLNTQQHGQHCVKNIAQKSKLELGKADIASFRSFESYARALLN